MSEPSAQNNQRITLEIFYCSIIVIVFKKGLNIFLQVNETKERCWELPTTKERFRFVNE